MNEVSVEDAASSLSHIIDQLSVNGQSVVVTRDGKPVAKITRAGESVMPPVDREKRRNFLENLRELRKRVKPASREEIRTAIEEGRE